MDRKEVIEEIRERVMLHAGKIGEKGKKHVLKTLTDTSDPWKSIREIQSSFGLGFPECDPAIQFLRALKMNSSSIHVRIFEELKEQLTTSLLDLSQENLLIMLNETIAFLSIEELKIVPISIMRQLSNIPDKYLGLLVSKGFISEFPFSVKCKAWELNSPYFIKYIDDHVGNYTKSAEDKSNSDSKIKQISTIISTSEKLFRTFCDHCVLKSCKESREWGGLLGKVLVKAQEMGKKVICRKNKKTCLNIYKYINKLDTRY